MSEREEVALSVRNEEDVSPECLAWADSCIISFPDDSENNNWGTFRDALTEIIDIHPEMFVATGGSNVNVVSPDEEMTETESIDLRRFEGEGNSLSEEVSEIISMLRFDSDPARNSLQDQYFPESTREKGTTRGPLDNAKKDLEGVERIEEDGVLSDGEVEEEVAELLSSQVFKDDFMNASLQDNVDDLNVLEEPVKVTPQEIFKVWDLEIAGEDEEEEEDGLVLQLKKALDQPRPLNNDDHIVAAEMSSVDDLIARISDMSLVETLGENAEA